MTACEDATPPDGGGCNWRHSATSSSTKRHYREKTAEGLTCKTSPVNDFSFSWHLTTCAAEVSLHILAANFTCCWSEILISNTKRKKFSDLSWVNMSEGVSGVARGTGWQWSWSWVCKSTQTPVNDSTFHWITLATKWSNESGILAGDWTSSNEATITAAVNEPCLKKKKMS